MKFNSIALRISSDEHARSIALMKFLSKVASKLGVSEHAYVVGGAVRNFLMDKPIKDIDVVFDSIGAGDGKDSDWFAKKVIEEINAEWPEVKTTLTTNRFKVAIISLSPNWVLDGIPMVGPKNKGETIEIANARVESYTGDSHKPDDVQPATIEDDLKRREFTFNTLLWKLKDLTHGPEKAEVIDLLGVGQNDLKSKTMRTPVDPDITFSDDPTRMIRAVKFISKFNFLVPDDVKDSIKRNAYKINIIKPGELGNLLLEAVFNSPNPHRSIDILTEFGLMDPIRQRIESDDTGQLNQTILNAIADTDITLTNKLKESGWIKTTPYDFLNSQNKAKFEVILDEFSTDKNFLQSLLKSLRQPKLDNEKLIVELGLKPQDRRVIKEKAVESILENPSLANDPDSLTETTKNKIVYG